MKYGKFEIRNYKSQSALSEETECFSLSFFYDGKRCADVSNSGTGGSDDIYPIAPFTYADIERIEDEMSQDTFLVDEDTTSEKLSEGVATLRSMAAAEKQLKKSLGKKCVFIKDDEIRDMGYKNKSQAPDERLFQHVKSTYPTAILLNGVPLDEAVRLVVETEKKAVKAMYEEASQPSI